MKELVKRTITEEVANLIVCESVKVISFGEVGAQGYYSEHIFVLSDDGTRVYRDEGGYSFMYDNMRYGRGVSVENLYKFAPFLKYFLGDSGDTTLRGDFRFGKDREWFHFDAEVGNHFFIRRDLIDEFFTRFDMISENLRALIGPTAVDVATDMLLGKPVDRSQIRPDWVPRRITRSDIPRY